MTDTPKTPFQKFLEHQGNAASETGKAFSALIPPDFREHSRNARREFLESFKVLIDGAQDAVEKEMEKMKQAREAAATEADKSEPTASTTGANKVKVEVS